MESISEAPGLSMSVSFGAGRCTYLISARIFSSLSRGSILLLTSWTLLSEALQYVKYIGLIRALETLAYLNSLPYTLLPIIMVP